MKTTIAIASQASADKVLSDLVMRRPKWKMLGRAPDEMDCYGFALAVYRDGLGLDLPDFTGEHEPVTIARWFRAQKESWVRLEQPEPYCLVALGRARHVTHVGVYHPEDRVYHLTNLGIVGQHPSTLHAYGYSLVEYYQHRNFLNA